MKTSLHISAAMLLCLTVPLSTLDAVCYVNVNSASPSPPYTNWATAATTIQDAIDVALPVDEVVVTNGVYAVGEHLWYRARVSVTKPLMVRSVNGPEVTLIDGAGAMRCVYLTNGATLAGFTLRNGVFFFHCPFPDVGCVCSGPSCPVGGGVMCESVSAVVSHFVLTGNSAGSGGGAFQGTLNNCIVYYNTSRYGPDHYTTDSTLNYSCTTPLPTNGVGNMSAEPELASDSHISQTSPCRGAGSPAYTSGADIDGEPWASPPSIGCDEFHPGGDTGPLTVAIQASFANVATGFDDLAAGNLRLQSNSPCINAGRNAYAPASPDLDGYPRLVGGSVDIGAYEFQSPQSAISYAWLQQYGLLTDGSADLADPDSDGHNNRQERRTGTAPTNSLSVLRLLAPVRFPVAVVICWQSVSGQSYFLERSTNLGAQLAFAPLASNIAGAVGTTVYADTNAVGAGPFFYRVGVKE